MTRNLRISCLALSIPNADNIDIGFRKVKAAKKKPDRADTSWEGGPGPRSGSPIAILVAVSKDVVYRMFQKDQAQATRSEDEGHLEVSTFKASVYLLEIVVSFFERHVPVTGSQRSPSSFAHGDRVLQAGHHV